MRVCIQSSIQYSDKDYFATLKVQVITRLPPGNGPEEVQLLRGGMLRASHDGPVEVGGAEVPRGDLRGGGEVHRDAVLPRHLLRPQHLRRQDGGQNIPRNRGPPQTVLYYTHK